MRRARLAATLALTLALAGCAGSGRSPPRPLVDVAPAESGDQDGGLVRELELEVLAGYRRLSLDPGSAAAAIDPTVGLTAIGVAPGDLGAGAFGPRWPVSEVDSGAGRPVPVEVVSRALELHLSADRTVGWAFDQLSLHLDVCGRTATIPLRAMQVYVRDSERWTLVSEHLAYAQPMGRWIDDATGPVGAALPRAVEVHADADAALATLTAAFAADGDRDASWDHAADTVAVWPDPMQVLRGGAVRTGPSLAASLGATALRVEGVRLALGPGRSEAIAAASLIATIDRGEAGPVDVRLRATAVLELVDATWKVRMAMVSAPIAVPALIARTVGVVATVTGDRVTARCAGAGGVALVSRAPSR